MARVAEDMVCVAADLIRSLRRRDNIFEVDGDDGQTVSSTRLVIYLS